MADHVAPKGPTSHTANVLAQAGADLLDHPLDHDDFVRARRGLLATHPTGRIHDHQSRSVWDINKYDFLRSPDVPDSAHPSLWRHAQLDAIHGLFEVAPGVWQVRGYDISNITFIAGATGWVVIDPLTAEMTAAACLALANAHLGSRPVTAVVYTHSHVDHFGGVLGVTSQTDVDKGNCLVIAPKGFLREAVAENVIAGPAMGRRAAYQFGSTLVPGPRGHIDCGLGIAIPVAQAGLIAPTDEIENTGDEMIVDGVRFVFQNTPNAEAPAEMNFFFPENRWLCMAENCSHTMHNLVPIRGAQVRDALAWSKYINEAIDLFAADSDVMFTSHHWPRWGTADIGQFLALQRDLYRWMHDQTMRHANHGLTGPEIAERLQLPPELARQSHTRGYYGHLAHNVKAVYQRYLSWYDGNPANLHPHPPVEAARRYVEFMGGPDATLNKARESFAQGDYRWVAEVVNHVVFADPANSEARKLQADTLEQLGYQAESSTFRNAYLTGARELREGPPSPAPVRRKGLLAALSVEQVFDSIAVRLKAEEVSGQRATITFRFTDIRETWVLGLDNCALHASRTEPAEPGDATLTMARTTLLQIVSDDMSFVDAMNAGDVDVQGDVGALSSIFTHLDTFMGGFPIVEP